MLLTMPLLLLGHGGENNPVFDPDKPLLGSWKLINEEHYLIDNPEFRTCIEEGYPNVIEFFANGNYNSQFWECQLELDGTLTRGDMRTTVGGFWKQKGELGYYLISDPNEDEQNEEYSYFEFNNDFSQFSIDNGEYISIFERQ